MASTVPRMIVMSLLIVLWEISVSICEWPYVFVLHLILSLFWFYLFLGRLVLRTIRLTLMPFIQAVWREIAVK